MKHRFALLAFLLCMMALTASAQNWGPFAPATTGSSYPANLCTMFTSNTCIISEACSPYHAGGYCTPAGPGGNHQDSGGMGGWTIYASNNQGGYYPLVTNSSSYSQGYVVIIGSAGQQWTIDANGAGTPNNCVWNPPGTYVFANNTFGSSKTYYRTVQICQ